MSRQRICFKRIIAFGLTSMVIAGSIDMPAISVSAEEVQDDMIYEEEVVEFEPLKTSAIPISLFSLEDGVVSLKSTNEEMWIDRIDLTGGDEIRSFYDVLVEASDNDGYNDYLIDDTYFNASEGYHITVCEKTGTATTEDEMKANASKIGAYVQAAYQAFDRDHPEVFWLSGSSRVSYGFSYSTSSSGINYTVTVYFILKASDFDIRAGAYQSQASIEAEITERDAKVDEYVNAVAGKSAYEQVTYFNEKLTKTNQYNTSSDLSAIGHDCRECVGALRGTSGTEGPVCEAYARAFKVLCDKVEIPCVLVDGQASSTGTNGGAHMWNYVKVDGAWYGVDVTWDDPSVAGVEAGTVESGYENAKWFLVGSDTLINSISFITSHPVSNQVSSSGIGFTNGPVLSTERYSEKASTETGKKKADQTLTGTAVYNKIYGEEAFVLDVQGNGDGAISYAVLSGNDKVSVDQNGKVTILQAGTTVVRVTAAETDNYHRGTFDVTINVAKAVPYISEKPTASEIEVGNALNVSILTGGSAVYGDGQGAKGTGVGCERAIQGNFAWKDASVIPTVADSGTTYYSVLFVPTDRANYETVETAVTLSVQKKEETKTPAAPETPPAPETPAAPETPPAPETPSAPKTGQVISDGETNAKYKVTKAGGGNGTVEYYRSTKKNAKNITIPATVSIDGISYKVTSVADAAFKGNKKLTKVTIGKNVTTIGKEAFRGCTKLKTVTLGKNVTTIGAKAFYKNTALSKITIPSKVKTIGKQSFYGCKRLKNITIKTTKLTSKNVGSKAFTGTYKKVQVKVPAKKVSAYKKLLKQKGISAKAKITK